MPSISFTKPEIRRYYESRVTNPKQKGREMRAPCPIHQGKRESLAINLETGTWFCHSGCNRGGSIFDFEAELFGVNGKDAFKSVLGIVGRELEPKRRSQSERGRIVATYDYVDERGEVLFQVVRHEPKGFKQRRPNGRGGWIDNLEGARRVLYRLPEVLRASIIFICEGEKDVDALTELGVTATCNPMGAGCWKPEYAESLRGKDVIIIPDDDKKGRAHADDVAQSLRGVAASVKRVELPGSKDAAEWIERGGTLEELVRLVEREGGNSTESGASLLDEIEQYIRRYVVLPAAAYLTIALWIIATHAVQTFDCFPYVAAISAVKRSGKTRLAEVLELLVRSPWRGTAPSPAALYRMLEGAPTLLLDEVEMFNSKNKSETALILLAVLNAGHRKGATIPRCEPPKQEVRLFPVYGPKFFAAIGRLPDTLLDRSIIIHMKRRSKAQLVERFRLAKAGAEAKPVRECAARFAETRAADIEGAYKDVLAADLTFLNDRDADLWTPLFTMCSVIAPERRAALEKCARELSAAKAGDDADDSWALTLLRDIQAVWPLGEEKLQTSILIDRLNALEESPWKEHQLTPRKLARTLRPFEIEARKVRIGESTARGYHYDHLKAAFDLYLDVLSGTSGTDQ